MEKILRQINEASLKFLSSQSIDEVYQTVLTEALSLAQADAGTIFLHENDQLVNAFSTPGFEDLVVRKRGYTYQAFIKNTPFFIEDQTVLQVHPTVAQREIKSILYIPLSYENKSIGVLTLRYKKKKKLPTKQLETLKLFGSMATLAIQKTKLHTEKTQIAASEEQSRQIEEIFRKINTAGLRFLTPLNYKEALHVVIKEAVHLLNADWGGLYLADKDDDLYEAATYPKGKRLFTPRRKGNTYKAFIERRTIIVHSKQIQTNHPELKDELFRSTFCIPLSFQRKSIGTLTIVSRQDEEFSKNHLQLLKVFGSYATLAIRKSILLDEMKEALEIRNLFISMAAHELRTPITTINGYIQLLKSKSEQTVYPQAKWIDQLHWETKRLIKLVNELLEVNRIKAGHFEYKFEECDMREIIQRALNTLKFTNPNRAVEFIDTNPMDHLTIIADFDKILQVIINILENAAKFSSSNSKIVIRLESKAKYIKISIQDYGKGIKEKDLKHLFEEFYKGHNPGTEEGMGLGLFIAKNIIKQHHGGIEVFSKENKGTRIDIKLPKMQRDSQKYKLEDQITALNTHPQNG